MRRRCRRQAAVTGLLLLDENVADVAGRDHGAEHVEQPHVLEHRDPDHEVGVLRGRALSKRAHRWQAGLHHAGDARALAFGRPRADVVGGTSCIEQLAAAGIGKGHGDPVAPRGEIPLGVVAEPAELASGKAPRLSQQREGADVVRELAVDGVDRAGSIGSSRSAVARRSADRLMVSTP
jgi:hypothetical protein